MRGLLLAGVWIVAYVVGLMALRHRCSSSACRVAATLRSGSRYRPVIAFWLIVRSATGSAELERARPDERVPATAMLADAMAAFLVAHLAPWARSRG